MSMYVIRLLFEAAVVAGITACALATAVYLLGPIQRPTHAFILGAVIGAVIHVLFEGLGANAMYCRTGAACLRSASS